ncbi:MAG: type II toxin-antitoxin system VapC family toxin [Candidatus Bathyarchaeia archaeon]
MSRRKPLEKTYVDVNVLYYYLTASEKYGEKSKDYISIYGGRLVTSTLTIWLLHVLTRLENLTSIMEEIGVELAPLTVQILFEAERLKKPRDLEDRIHVSTMNYLGIKRIISNDRDFDLPGVERLF